MPTATVAGSSKTQSAIATDGKGKKRACSASVADRKGKEKAVISTDDNDNYFDDDHFLIDDEFEEDEDIPFLDNTSIDLDSNGTSDPQLSDLGLRSDVSALPDIGDISYDDVRTKRRRRRPFRRNDSDLDEAATSDPG